jgi:AcrR family transcriptional regulator
MRANSQPRRDIAKPSVGRRLRRIEHEDVQEPAMRLVLAAARLFNEHGIHATGIDRIIAEAGVARMTFYKHFGSKEGLVRAVMERESKAWFEWLDAELRRLQEPRQRISAFFTLLGKWFSRSAFKGCCFINAVGERDRLDNSVRPIARAHRKATFVYIRSLLEGSALADPDQLADQLTILADGATVTAMVTGNPRTAGSAAKAALALMDAADL